MNYEFKYKKTLEWINFPLIFIGTDNFNTDFFCYNIATNIESDMYICVPISEKRLSKFCNNKISLNNIFLKPEVNRYFIYSVNRCKASSINECELNENYLPEEHFYYKDIINNMEVGSESSKT